MKQNELDADVREFAVREMEPALLTAWADRIISAVLDSLPSFAAEPALVEKMRLSAQSQWTAFLVGLPEPEQDVPLIPMAAEMAIEIARRGHSLKELFQVYRITRRVAWQYISGRLLDKASGAENVALFILVWDRAGHWIDAVVDSSATLFEAERDLVRQGAAAQKFEMVRTVLEGGPIGSERDLFEALGGHPIGGFQTALVMSCTNVDELSELNRLALELARGIDVRNPLLVNPGGRDLWVWLGTARPPALDDLVSLRPELAARDIRVAIGSPGVGVEGFRQSHEEALHAHAVAAAGNNLPNPVYFPDVETLLMLWESGQLAVRFVQRTLGKLYENTDYADRLRATARSYLRAGTLAKAADTLNVHQSTVRYRLHQVEEVLGRSLTADTTSLSLALEYHAVFVGSAEPPVASATRTSVGRRPHTSAR